MKNINFKNSIAKALSVVLVFALVLGMAPSVFASTGAKTLSASYGTFKVYNDLKQFSDTSLGAPFIANGTTYLPVRAIAQALDKDVEWNDETNTVYIKDKVSGAAVETPAPGTAAAEAPTGQINILANYSDIKIVVNDKAIDPKDANGNTVEPFIVDGRTYLPVRAVATALDTEIAWDGGSSSVYIAKTPYDVYEAADEAITSAGSFEGKADIKANIEIKAGTESAVLEMDTTGDMQVIYSDPEKLEMAMKFASDMLGQKATIEAYFKDGVMYQNIKAATAPAIKSAMKFDMSSMTMMMPTNSSKLMAEWVKSQSISADGKTITLTLDGTKIKAEITKMLDGMNIMQAAASTASALATEQVIKDMVIGDITISTTLDDANALKAMTFAMPISVSLQGTSMEMKVSMDMNITKVGNVKITYPTDLSSYPLTTAPTPGVTGSAVK